MKISEVRQKSTDELRTQIKKIHEEHFSLRFRRVTDVIENPQALRELRKDLARIHTVIRERETGDAKKAPPPAPAKAAPAPAAAKEAPKAEKKGAKKGEAKKSGTKKG